MHSSILGAGLLGAAALWSGATAIAAPACKAPQRVLERFIDADCESCWAAPAQPGLPASTWVLDWIVPGSQGAAAPLAIAALPEAAERLAMQQGLALIDGSAEAVQALTAVRPRLRVVGGPAWNGYLGLRLEAQGRAPAGAQAFLALVEDIPAGAEGNPSARRLVRAVAGPIDMSHKRTEELRAMRIPEGAKPERLQGVAWWINGDGRVGGMAAERCKP
jgi:hypothetical protein